MIQRRDERYENDTTQSRAVVERYRKALEDDSEASLALVHYRGGQEEFDLGVQYTKSVDPLDRATGAAILAQLGWGDRTFLDQSIAILIQLLHDTEPTVVSSAAAALGHRDDPRAVPALVKLARSPEARIRRGVVSGLLGHDEPLAVHAMIHLSQDPDYDVRNWATFGLGSQIDSDTSQIRDALAANVCDPDHEIRGEALVGLAQRKDARVVGLLINEWDTHETVSRLSIEAAEAIADSRLCPHLLKLKADLPLEADVTFRAALLAAIRSCGGEAEQQAGG